MAKKSPALAPPSVQSIDIILQQAANAPLQNLQHAAAVDKALQEVAAFFRALLQIKSQDTGAASNPQALASAEGSSKSQA